MSCNQTLAGIIRDCSPNIGGIKSVLLANYDDVSAVTVTDELVSAITMADSAKFKKYAFKPGTGSMTSNLNKNVENDTAFWATDLVLSFSKQETAKRIEINALAIGELAAIVEDMNGKFWYLGKDEPVLATAGAGVTGTARGDKNGYDITLQDNAKQSPYEVDASIVEALIG